MVAPQHSVGQGPNTAPSDRSRSGSRGADGALETNSRALRLTADAACAGLLFYSWFADQAQLGQLLTLWLVSNVALPWPRMRERIRSSSMVSGLFLLLGLGLITVTVLGGSFGTRTATLYQARNVLQGLMFALAGLSNLVALRAYPERKTTAWSLCCGAAAVAAGAVWVWLTMHPGS